MTPRDRVDECVRTLNDLVVSGQRQFTDGQWKFVREADRLINSVQDALDGYGEMDWPPPTERAQ